MFVQQHGRREETMTGFLFLGELSVTLTTEGGELLGLSVGHDGSQRLLPVLQLARVQDVVPVLHHHGADQLHDKHTVTSSTIHF